MEDRFSRFHPAITFIFYIGAVVFAMVFYHPAYLIAAAAGSAAFLLTVRGRRAFKLMAGLAVIFVVIMAVNPFVNTLGPTVLFRPFGRPYTLEALRYGAAVAAILVSVIMWFASYNEGMTSDKFVYLFGRFAPSVTLILTMVLRFIPNYIKKARQIEGARLGIGRGYGSGNKERMNHAANNLSALMSWALEGGVITADSMKSRGYGSGKRTAFSTYRFGFGDKVLLGVLAALAAGVIGCSLSGGTAVSYAPEYLPCSLKDPACLSGLVLYSVFVFIPTVINVTEAVKWRILRSGI